MNKSVTVETTPEFIKSSFSGGSGCVEVKFRKSSYSVPEGECVDVSVQKDQVIVRDSKDPDGPSLFFNKNEWKAFIDGVILGEFDLDD